MGATSEQLTLGLAAVQIGNGVQHHHLDRLARRNAIPFVRIGRLRLIRIADLEVIRAACEQAGYTRAVGALAHA